MCGGEGEIRGGKEEGGATREKEERNSMEGELEEEYGQTDRQTDRQTGDRSKKPFSHHDVSTVRANLSRKNANHRVISGSEGTALE